MVPRFLKCLAWILDWAVALAALAACLWLAATMAGCVNRSPLPPGNWHLEVAPYTLPMGVGGPPNLSGAIDEAEAYWDWWGNRDLLRHYETAPAVIVMWGDLHRPPVNDPESTLGHTWRADESGRTTACTVVMQEGQSEFYVVSVLEHELGHCLGLPHDETDPKGIMYPFVRPDAPPSELTLLALDEIP